MEHLDIVNNWKKKADLSAYGRFSSLMDLFVILNSYGIDVSKNNEVITDSVLSCFKVNEIENFYLKGKFKQYLLQDIANAYILTLRDNVSKVKEAPIPLVVEKAEEFEEYKPVKEVSPDQEILDMKPEDFKEMEIDLEYCKLLGDV